MKRLGALLLMISLAAAILLVAGSGGGGSSTSSAGAACSSQCGDTSNHWRWDIKTASDAEAANIPPAPQDTTVPQLIGKHPSTLQSAHRNAPDELTIFEIQKAKLLGFKLSVDDEDFHVVIGDPDDPTTTMIVEFPNPKCGRICKSAATNPYYARIQQARADFVAIVGGQEPTGTFKKVEGDFFVRVRGIGFYDKKHGQIGLAKNCIELHPVLEIEPITPPTQLVVKKGTIKKHKKSYFHCPAFKGKSNKVSGPPSTPPMP